MLSQKLDSKNDVHTSKKYSDGQGNQHLQYIPASVFPAVEKSYGKKSYIYGIHQYWVPGKGWFSCSMNCYVEKLQSLKNDLGAEIVSLTICRDENEGIQKLKLGNVSDFKISELI